MRFQKSILSLFVIPALVSCLSVPSSLNTSEVTSSTQTLFTVDFETFEGTVIPPQTIGIGETIQKPENPEKEGYFFLNWYENNPQQPWIFNQTINRDLTLYANWEIAITTPAILKFQLSIPIDWVIREQYEIANVEITNTQTPWLVDHASLSLRGRGNGGSWGYEQKGYRLKFDQKISLLGEDASKHWVLTPGGHDFGLIRNHAAFTIGQEVLTDIPFTSSSRYVEVYFNDQYHGLYNLFEHVRVDEDRIDIESDYGILDTGYLLELDAYASGIEGIDYFYTQGIRYAWSVKSPEPDEWESVISETAFRDQVSYIQLELQTFINAVYDANQSWLEGNTNLASMVDMYILHELFKNTDTGWSSFYVYRPASGQWQFAPPWDFDFTAGISRGDGSTSDLYVADTIRYYSEFTSSEIFVHLMQQPWFVERVKTRYLQVSPAITTVVLGLQSIAMDYQAAFIRHANRWYWYGNWQAEHAYVIQWLHDRNQWLVGWAQNE